jgi:hypothetical protein
VLQRADIVGDGGDEGGQLPAQERHDQQQHIDKGNYDHRDDDQRRHQPVDAELLQPVGDRRQEIGDRRAGDERQQDLAQQPQRQHHHDQHGQPEIDLTLEGLAVDLRRRDGLLPPPWRSLAHGFAAAAFMWRIHSAT